MVEATRLLSPLPVRLYATNADTERGVSMYSSKIDEKLIPELYRLAKELDVPMTRLVNAMIFKGIEQIKRRKNHVNDTTAIRRNGNGL
jgi:hypothetical protein